MTHWLLVVVFTMNGNYAGKAIQGPFPNQAACEQVQRMTKSVQGDPQVKSRCISDDVWQGRAIDPRPSLFNSAVE